MSVCCNRIKKATNLWKTKTGMVHVFLCFILSINLFNIFMITISIIQANSYDNVLL